MNDTTGFPIVGKGTFIDNPEWNIFTGENLNEGEDDKLYFKIRSDTDDHIGRKTDSISYYAGQWIYVCGTYDGSSAISGIKIYINGVRVDTTNDTEGSYTATSPRSMGLWIGKGLIGDTYADGNIRDIRVYNGELSVAQVVKDYKVGEIASSNTVSLIAEYKLYKNAEDSGPNNFHGDNTDVTFPKVTIPTSYSFGDSLANPMFKKVIGNIEIESIDASPSGLGYPFNKAYGVWEFDVYKASGATSITFGFIHEMSTGYWFTYNASEEFSLQEYPALNFLMTSTSSYPIETWYNIRIVRNETENQYINGVSGAFGIYVDGALMDVSVGTNPVVDTTTITSSFMLLDSNTLGDKIRNMKFNNELLNHSLFSNMLGAGSLDDYTIKGDRENSYNFFERGQINPVGLKPIYTYTKSKTITDELPTARLTTTTSSSTSTSTTSSSTSTTSTSSTSTSTSTTSTSLSTSTT